LAVNMVMVAGNNINKCNKQNLWWRYTGFRFKLNKVSVSEYL
jgi:hypothetical protein